jgi:hypothetical protein
MPVPATTGVQSDVLASTLRILRDKYVDSTFKSIPLLDAVQSLGNTESLQGGSYIDHPLLLTDHSTITQLDTGYEPVGLAVKDPLRTGTFRWCDAVAPVVLTRVEELSNRGPPAQIRILDARLKQTLGMFRREVNKQILVGSSTILTNLQTLNGIGAQLGWLEELPFGTQNNTVGGVDKADFTSSWQNQVQDGPFSANGLQKMQALLIDCQQYSPEGDVDLILASALSYGLFKNELQTQERYGAMTEERDMAGRLGLKFNGALMYIDSNLGASYGGDALSMYFLNTKLFTVYFDSDAKFTLGPMEPISGFVAKGALLALRMQIAASNLAGHGVLVNAET